MNVMLLCILAKYRNTNKPVNAVVKRHHSNSIIRATTEGLYSKLLLTESVCMREPGGGGVYLLHIDYVGYCKLGKGLWYKLHQTMNKNRLPDENLCDICALYTQPWACRTVCVLRVKKPRVKTDWVKLRSNQVMESRGVLTLRIFPPVSSRWEPVSSRSDSVSSRSDPVSSRSDPVSSRLHPVSSSGSLSPVGCTLSPVGRTLSPVGRTLSPVGRALSPVGRTLSPVGRTLSPVGQGHF